MEQVGGVPKAFRVTGYILRLVVFFVVSLFVVLNIVIGIRGASQTAHPARNGPCCLNPAEYAGYDFEDVTFLSRDGLKIAGWYIPSRNGAAVVLSHGHSTHRAMTMPVGVMLAEAGYGVLMIDLRAHGESEGDLFTLWQAGDDILGAVDYLQTRSDVDPERIGVWGHSAGASASVHAAAQSEAIKVIAADGLSWTRFKDARGLYRGATWQYLIMDLVQFTITDLFYAGGSQPRALIDDVALIAPRPMLIFVAANHPYGNETLAAEQYQAAGGESVSIWIVPDTVHGGGWDVHPDDYRQHLLEHFAALLDT